MKNCKRRNREICAFLILLSVDGDDDDEDANAGGEFIGREISSLDSGVERPCSFQVLLLPVVF